MKRNYGLSIELKLHEVKPEEIASITKIASDVYQDGYGPEIINIEPEYTYDEGCKDEFKGTYEITFGVRFRCGEVKTSDDLKRVIDYYFGDLQNIEESLTR